jgi:hypothetical protein
LAGKREKVTSERGERILRKKKKNWFWGNSVKRERNILLEFWEKTLLPLFVGKDRRAAVEARRLVTRRKEFSKTGDVFLR